MRFIRDIIKEKRDTSAEEPRYDEAHTALDAPVEPLVLKTRVYDETSIAPETPDAFEEEAYVPAEPDEVEPSPDAFMAQGTRSDDDAELSDYEDYDDDDEEVQSLLDAIDRERMASMPPDVAEEEALEEGNEPKEVAEDDVTDEDIEEFLDRPDPFDKLRVTQNTAPPVQKPISAMRGAGLSAVVKPAEPMPAPEPKATAHQEALDALKPAADAMDAPLHMPSPAKGRGSGRSGRVKTRLLGFSAGTIERNDPFEQKSSTGSSFPVGWLVVVSDMGRGASFPLQEGVSRVGRGIDQTVSLNFGDNSISRDNHVSIAFDTEQNKFFIGHSGKTNMVRVNNIPLLSTEELKSKDLIRLGETTLRFIAFCADDFSWTQSDDQVAKHA